MTFKSLFLLAFVLLSAEGKEIFRKCAESDSACIRETTQDFLRNSHAGNPEWGVKATDPLVTPSVDIDATKEGGVIFHYKNVNIAGFKNVQLLNNDLNLAKGSETLKLQADISFTADVEVEIPSLQKTFKGPYSASATVLASVLYPIGVKEVDGKQYFVIGPETITSETVGESTVNVGNEILSAIDADEEAAKLKPQWESNVKSIQDKILTTIANNGFATVVGNLRALGNVFDKTVFFKDA